MDNTEKITIFHFFSFINKTFVCRNANVSGGFPADAPVCRPEQVRIFGVAREEVAQITCEVEANPNDVDFTWKFNNSADTFEIAQTQVSKGFSPDKHF